MVEGDEMHVRPPSIFVTSDSEGEEDNGAVSGPPEPIGDAPVVWLASAIKANF